MLERTDTSNNITLNKNKLNYKLNNKSGHKIHSYRASCAASVFSSCKWLALLSVLLLFACSKPQPQAHDELVGAYLAKEKGKWVVMAKITKNNNQYYIHYKKNTWSKNALKASPVLKQQFQAISSDKNAKFLGLGSQKLAILKVPNGTQIGKFKTKTGYWLITQEGPVELVKQESKKS